MPRARRSRKTLQLEARETRTKRAALDPELNPAVQAIWDAVAQIPRGRVSTYGAVARAADLPGRARQAGYALKHAPAELPWHRVVGAGGKIAFPKGTRSYREQVRRLTGEGVRVVNGRVDRAALIDGALPGD